jgi:hypothetical protein
MAPAPKILYIILSCGPLLATRGEWQRRSWLAHIPANSYLFLTGHHDVSGANIIKMNMGDGYESCPHRYYEYIRREALEGWDWVVFVDDDTFVFPRRLEAFLSGFDAAKPLYIGRLLDWPTYFMSGGAGFCLSAAAYAQLRTYLLETARAELQFELNGDVTMGVWILANPVIERVNSRRFNGCIATHHESCPLEDGITYHYVTKELFEEYGKLL